MHEMLIFVLGAGLGAGLMFLLIFLLSALVVSGRIEDSERRTP